MAESRFLRASPSGVVPNAPGYVDSDVDISKAPLTIGVRFKTLSDYGMIYANRAGHHRPYDVHDQLIKELHNRKAHFTNALKRRPLEQYMFGCTAGSCHSC